MTAKGNLLDVEAAGPREWRRLQHLLTEIKESRAILDLQDDWDEEGSPGYTHSTWKLAVNFLVQNALWLWLDNGIPVEPPRILPGPDGSIDIHWQTCDHELLVNVPRDVGTPATYYGDTSAGESVKGSLDLSADNQWLLKWLTE